MAYAHVAHDCRIGNHVILGNSVGAGRARDDRGLGGCEPVQRRASVLPDRPACVRGAVQGDQAGRDALFATSQRSRRCGCSGRTASGWSGAGSMQAAIEALQTAFRLLTRAGLNTSQAIERIRAEVPPCAEVEELLEFIASSRARRD